MLPAVFRTVDDLVQNERLLNRLRTAKQLGHLGGEGGARRRTGAASTISASRTSAASGAEREASGRGGAGLGEAGLG